jgi:serine/threonine protein kinase
MPMQPRWTANEVHVNVHEQGIVHRDLKLENILMSSHSDDAILKVLFRNRFVPWRNLDFLFFHNRYLILVYQKLWLMSRFARHTIERLYF